MSIFYEFDSRLFCLLPRIYDTVYLASRTFIFLDIKYTFEIFPPTLSIHLQNTFTKEKFLASAVLYMYGVSKAA